jgi:hypothetical protein
MTVATAVWTVLCDSFCDTNLTSQLGFLRLIKRDAKSADLDDSSPLRGSNVEHFVLSAPGHTHCWQRLRRRNDLNCRAWG